jgi:predicted metalloprotease with PDZ domain
MRLLGGAVVACTLITGAAVVPAVAADKSSKSDRPAAPPTVTVAVDATETRRKIFHARLNIPASPGSLTLCYPKWIPGEHGPTGPVEDLAGLKFMADGKTLAWRRDLLDGWTFHVDVPPGVTAVEASLDFISPTGEGGIYTGGVMATDKMAVVNWNTLLLYPLGWTSDELTYQASLRLPPGWKLGTALPAASQNGDETVFKPVSLTTLVDSPVITGEYLRVEPLAENPHQEMDIAADSAAALDAPAEVFDHYRKLTEQAQKLFTAQHFRDYHFLFSLSDHVAHFGLEHHESNDSRLDERALVDPEIRVASADLLPHEYVHSWNGKFRMPAGLATPDYEKPMQTDLLWVYEGLTEYYGDVMAARSGLWTAEQFRQQLARYAAQYDYRPGRIWRNLQDTADGVPSMQYAPRAWTSWRRELDYYVEDLLNWLWVDTIIRQQTQNKASLDDFCKLFYGGRGGAPELKTYTFDDIVNTLNQVAPHDWRGFWTERLTNHGPGAPLRGIEESGWKVAYDETRTESVRFAENSRRMINAAYSIGLLLTEDGKVIDTIEAMVAAKAGIGPGMRVVAVNGRRFSSNQLRTALRAGKNGTEPLELLVENDDYFTTYRLDYHGGEKYPHLERDSSKPDLLSDILKPR